MLTTIIAIYGAVVATVSTLLGAWYFTRSGPSLQANANVDSLGIGQKDEWNDDRCIIERYSKLHVIEKKKRLRAASNASW